MNFDRTFFYGPVDAVRADLQARADMLAAAARDFDRHKRCMCALESALVRWLAEHRNAFGDRFCTHAVLAKLPLEHAADTDKAAGRLRARVEYSRTLRTACFRALSERRAELGALAALEAQVSMRLQTCAFACASDAEWDLPALDAARTALEAMLTEAATLGEREHLYGAAECFSASSVA